VSDLSTPGARPRTGAPRASVVLVGKVGSESGSLDGRPVVSLKCDDRVHSDTYADTKGGFSLSVSVSDDARTNFFQQRETGTIRQQDWVNCEVYAELPGYTSEHIRLSGGPANNIVQVGTIILHPLTRDPNSSVSVTSLAAPSKAKQNLSKGLEQEKKGKWAAACDYFKKALAEYPRYALAWLELGRAQVKQNSFSEAQQSFREAVTQDSRFVEGYAELAHLALEQKQWKDLADTTDQLLQLSPESSAEYWFLNSAAYFKMGNAKQAEESVTRGLRLDPKHQVPQMEYLYGLILATKQDYKSASEHVSAYLQLSPQASDAAGARSALAEFQRRSSSTP
jgi:Tfp pilus assembly protein PilF